MKNKLKQNIMMFSEQTLAFENGPNKNSNLSNKKSKANLARKGNLTKKKNDSEQRII